MAANRLIASVGMVVALAACGPAPVPSPSPPAVPTRSAVPSLPASSTSAVTQRSIPAWTCPPREASDDDWLDCDASVAAALALLEPDDSDIASIRFEHGPCPCPEGMLCDCAFHLFGTVTINFVDGPPKVMSINGIGNGRPVATFD
jgi:hypothetical protein